MNDSATRLGASAFASAFVETCTLPLEVCKVKLQVDGRYSGLGDVFKQTVRKEGAAALFKGYTPTLFKQVNYTALVLFGYEPIRDLIAGSGLVKDGQAGLLTRLTAAGIAGGLGMAALNPAEVIKTQIQAADSRKGILEVGKRIVARDGLKGLAAGIYPNVIKAAMVDAAVIGTYDHAKSLMVPYLGDNIWSQVGASVTSGVACAVIGTPVDVIKVRFMAQAGGEKAYRGMFHAGVTIVRQEGFWTLYSGFAPFVIRQPLWCILFFVVYENTRQQINNFRGISVGSATPSSRIQKREDWDEAHGILNAKKTNCRESCMEEMAGHGDFTKFEACQGRC